MSGSIDYGNLMHNAMRGLIKSVLEDVAKDGLPGDHHFFVNFNTRHPDADLADWMHDRFPEDMTIVLQHWFDDLTVTNDGFGVTLNFGDTPETMFVPFDAINTFVDPSVEFGLRFETQDSDHHANLHIAGEDDEDLEDEDATEEAPEVELDEVEEEPKDAEVVSLDSFRK